MTPQELIREAQAATVRLGASTLERVGEDERRGLEAARDRVNETVADVEQKVGDVTERVRNDPEARNLLIGAAAGAGVVAVLSLVVWAWRRRRRRKQQRAPYDNTVDGVPGWNDPHSELAATADHSA